MNQPLSAHQEAKPYKGPESYQIEDAHLFFGREQEASQLIAQILSARMTLLHAQSGAGKSSLLNARVIPGLESRGLSVVRILFNNSPINCVREVTLAYLTPPPAAELQAIDEAIKELCAPGEEISLSDLLARFDQLQPRDIRRQRIASPIINLTGSDQGWFFQQQPIYSFFCRMVRATLDVEGFAEHLLAVYQQIGSANAAELPLQINGQTPMSELRKFIASPALTAAYRGLIAALSSAPPGLSGFFDKLFEVYGRRRSRFSLVLIFDQFEELFTRFIDPGPSPIKLQMDLPDWRLKWELINQLEELYGSETESANTLPIRYVISMRDEYIAQLGPIRQFAWNLDKNSFHLNLLDKDQAALAIKQPEGHALDEAVAELLRTLKTGSSLNKQIKVNAYGLLGRLKAAGREIQRPALPFFSRLRLALSLNGYLYGPRRWLRVRRRLGKGWWGGMIGAVAALFLSAFVTHWNASEDNLSAIAVLCVAASATTLVSAVVAYRTSPINLQFDRMAGVTAEILVSSLAVIIPAVILALLYFLISKLSGTAMSVRSLLNTINIWFIGGLLAGLIRFGTILVFGMTRDRSVNLYRQTFFGTILAMIALVMISYFYPLRNLGHDDALAVTTYRFFQFLVDTVSPTFNDRALWLVFIPFFCGVAYTFASIDSESPPSGFKPSRPARIAYFSVSALFIILLTTTLYLGYQVKRATLTGYESILGFTSDSKYLATMDNLAQKFALWDLNKREITHKFLFDYRIKGKEGLPSVVDTSDSALPPLSSVWAAALSLDGRQLALGGNLGGIFVWDVQTQQLVWSTQKQSESAQFGEAISCLTFSPDSQYIISGQGNGVIKIWNMEGAERGNFASPSSPPPISFVFVGAGARVLAVSSNSIEEFDLNARKSLGVKLRFEESISAVTASSDGKYLATIRTGKAMKFWDLQTGKAIWAIPDQRSADEMKTMRGFTRTLILSSDGGLLLIGTAPFGFEIWETKTPRQLAKIDFEISNFFSLALSPDGKFLAASNYSFTRLWELDKLIK